MRDHWAGVSYVNLLALDRKLFVPAFGLGEFEERVFSGIARGLGGRYRVEPTYARTALLSNGGAHCVVGLVREPPPGRGTGVSSD